MRKLVLSSVLLPLVFAAPALAVPPTTEVTVVELGDFASVNTELCGFPIAFDESDDTRQPPSSTHPETPRVFSDVTESSPRCADTS